MNRLAAVILLGAAVALSVVDGRGAPVAGAQPSHRAVVVVDLGDGQPPKAACVRFAEESISGIEALRRAGMDPVVRSFSGQGGAVCALCGKGCPADETCLTCGGGSYWSYHRAPAGSGRFSYSGTAASSTRVRDGDVEGWRWGSGGAPALLTVAHVCGEAPRAAVPAAPGTTSTTLSAPTTTTTAIHDAATGTTAVTTTTALTTTATGSTTATGPPARQEAELTQRRTAPRQNKDEDDGSPASLVLLGGALAGIGGLTWRARRARSRRTG